MATLGRDSAMGRPCHRTSPALGVARPESMRRSVDLPEPDGPSSAMIIPGPTDRSVGAITWTRPPSARWNDFSTWRAWTMASTGGRARKIDGGAPVAAESLGPSSSIRICQDGSGNSSNKRTRSAGFVVEEDAVAEKHPVGFPVVHHLVKTINFCACIRAARMERRAFSLRNLDHLAKHLAGRSLVQADRLVALKQ